MYYRQSWSGGREAAVDIHGQKKKQQLVYMLKSISVIYICSIRRW